MNTNFNSNKNENLIQKTFKYRLTSVFDQPPRVKTSSSPNRKIFHLIKSELTNNVMMPNIVTNYNIQNINLHDTDRLKDELIKAKSELNKRNKEYNAIKVAFNKVDSENKKSVKIIEEILEEAIRQNPTLSGDPTSMLNENDIKNLVGNSTISSSLFFKLKESNTLNILKRTMLEYKLILESKEEEFSALKNTTKASKYQELDTKLKNTKEELNLITESYNRLKILSEGKDLKIKELSEERDYYKAMMIRIKNQTDDSKEKLHIYIGQNEKLQESNKKLEDRIKSHKLKDSVLKNQVAEKDNELANLKEEIVMIDTFKSEKIKLEKSISLLNKNLSSSKEENEKKSRKIKELEEKSLDYVKKIEKLNAENKRLLDSLTTHRKSFQADKEKKYLQLDEKNKKLSVDLNSIKASINTVNNKESIELASSSDANNLLISQQKEQENVENEYEDNFNNHHENENNLQIKSEREDHVGNEDNLYHFEDEVQEKQILNQIKLADNFKNNDDIVTYNHDVIPNDNDENNLNEENNYENDQFIEDKNQFADYEP